MIKKSNQKLKTNSNEKTAKDNLNKDKSNNETVGVEYHATRNAITLIALVITIIVLLILAGVTINLVLGPEGLLKQAQNATDKYKEAEETEVNNISNILDQFDYLKGDNTDNVGDAGTEDESGETTLNKSVLDVKGEDEFKETTQITDVNGNKITIPAGFKVTSDSGETVQQGIVIEDVCASNQELIRGSQFVWIPVGEVILDDGTKKNITLGRYEFTSTTFTLKQAAVLDSEPKNYEKLINIGNYSEIYTHRYGVNSEGSDGINATSFDLASFINNTLKYGGFFLARYEASVPTSGGIDYCASVNRSNWFVETSPNVSSRVLELGSGIQQWQASLASSKSYADCSSVRSDLVNSYVWDTALVYLYEMGNVDYIGATSKYSLVQDPGVSGDIRCNIYDISGNLSEWTTEYSSYYLSKIYYPCVLRGGHYRCVYLALLFSSKFKCYK